MFIDDDVLLDHTVDTTKLLVEADKDIVAGVTLIRGYPYHPMIFNFYGQIIDANHKGHFIDDYKDIGLLIKASVSPNLKALLVNMTSGH